MFFAAGPVEQAIMDKVRDLTPDAKQQTMIGYGDYDRAVDVLEAAVTSRPYIAGDRFTAADVYVGSQVIWGTRFGTLPKRDGFMPYVERLTARDAYRKAKARDDALIASMQVEAEAHPS